MTEKEKKYAEILRKETTPFYIFDTDGFVRNFRDFEKAMRDIYPRYQLSYSYKTNYTPYICRLVKSLGGYAEVVSDMELELARRIGYEPSQIVYNGPEKGPMMESHLFGGGIVNIDNISEAMRIADLAVRNQAKEFKVGLRINMHLDNAFVSRFGMEPSGAEIKKVKELLANISNIKISGLHCHISRHRSLESWRQRAQIMIETADRYIDGVPEYISLGSGMFGDLTEELKSQFGPNVPSYNDYSCVAMTPFKEKYGYLPIDNQPIIFTEPGTTIVGRYIDFISTVKNIKTIHNRSIAIVDGSYENLGEICGLKKLPLINMGGSREQLSYQNIDITGYTCLEQDLLIGNYRGKMGKGDVLAIQNVGAYSIVSKPQFIHPNCPMYAIVENGNYIEIMRAETFDDVFSKFNFV